MKFGPGLKKWRENQRLSQANVANSAKVTLEEYIKIEDGETEVNESILTALCPALHIRPAFLIMLALTKEDVYQGRQEMFSQLKDPIINMMLTVSKPTGVELISRERQEHFTKHGRSIQNDIDNNPNGELLMAAKGLIDNKYSLFPPSWETPAIQKMMLKDHIDRLVVAGSFIAAEIDRLLAIENNK